MLQVPAPTAVTRPAELIVATEVLLLLQAPVPPLTTTELAVNVAVPPTHKGEVPVTDPILALDFTTTVAPVPPTEVLVPVHPPVVDAVTS